MAICPAAISAGMQAPASKRLLDRWRGLALGNQVRALGFEVEDLQHALVGGLVDDHVRRRHEDLVEELGLEKRAENFLASFAREVTHTAIREQPRVGSTQARRL